MDKKNMSFNINNKSNFINNLQFLSSSLDSFVKNLGKDDFKYLSQQFDNNVLDLVTQKGFDPYEWFRKNIQRTVCKEKFYSSLTSTNISDKEYKHVLND